VQGACAIYSLMYWSITPGEVLVKKIAVALALVVVSMSLAGCFVGKGKAPAPIVTKG